MTDQNIYAPGWNFLQANAAMQALANHLARLHAVQLAVDLERLEFAGQTGFEATMDDDAIRWAEEAQRILAETLYPEPEQADPITAAKAEAFR